jgi:hypothetical protein
MDAIPVGGLLHFRKVESRIPKTIPKRRKVILVEERELYPSSKPSCYLQGYVEDSTGEIYSVSIPDNVKYSDLMILEKNDQVSSWPEWTAVDASRSTREKD